MALGTFRPGRLQRALLALSGLFVLVFMFGFLVFAAHVMREEATLPARADGIVVLTGGDQRIDEAARLLNEGRANRLLISGVNRRNSHDDIRRIVRVQSKLFDCCVDLGYAARDTIGNASETRRWAEKWHYSRLIVVTASYHMPRSLAELSRAFPEAEFYPYPVLPKQFRSEPWWLNPALARRLLSEYVKYLPSAAMLTASRWAAPKLPAGITAQTRGQDGAG